MTRRALLRKGVDLGWAAGVVALTGSLASCSRGAETQRIAPLARGHGGDVVRHPAPRVLPRQRLLAVRRDHEDSRGPRCATVRDRLVTTVPESVLYLEQLGDRGISTLLTISEDARYPGHLEDPETVISRMSDHLVALAGDNEPNAKGRPPDWVSRTVELQQWIWDVGQDLGLTVCSPSLQQKAPTLEEDYSALSAEDVGDLCDVIAIHNYPRGRSPSEGIDEYSAMARGRSVPTRRSTAPRAATSPRPTTRWRHDDVGGCAGAVRAASAARVRPSRHAVLAVRADGRPRPAGADREANFGLIATPSLDPATWRPKPAFDTMKDLLAKMADPGPAYEPAPISISVDGPDDLENIVVGRRDGSYQVVAWRDVDVYDPRLANHRRRAGEGHGVGRGRQETVVRGGRGSRGRPAPVNAVGPGV